MERESARADIADFSYERLATIRMAARQLLDSGVLFIHERTHVTEIIGRIDAAVQLKNERASYATEKKADQRQKTQTHNVQPQQAAPTNTASNPGQAANGNSKAASYGARA